MRQNGKLNTKLLEVATLQNIKFQHIKGMQKTPTTTFILGCGKS